MINPLIKERIDRFIDELLEDDDIDIIPIKNVNSIVMWVWCRTKRALEKFRRMIECGNFQELIVVLFTLLLDNSEDVHIAIKLNVEEFQWTEDCISRKSGMEVKI